MKWRIDDVQLFQLKTMEIFMIEKNKLMLAFLILSIFPLTTSAASGVNQNSKHHAYAKSGAVEKSGDLGVGVRWGSLTGVTLKYWTNDSEALQLGAAFADGNTALGLDYLWHSRQGVSDMIHARQSAYFVPYIGAGLITAFGSNTKFFNRNTETYALAARMPLGLEFLPAAFPIGVFAELAPAFGFVPTTYTFITADIGARYYF
jgi:hypothetical protein